MVICGSAEEWLSFNDLFKTAIVDNDKLSGTQKLQYLKCSLKGDALRIVQALTICDKNFEIAWNLLCQRFSNKRELLSSLLKKILCLTSLQAENPSQLLTLVDTVKECICSFETLGFKVQQFADTILMFIVQFKLDSSTRSWWERTLKREEIPTLNDLLEFLKSHARTLQAGKQQGVRKQPTKEKLTSLASEIQAHCTYCKAGHSVLKCNKFLSLNVQDRINFVKKNNLCFNCLVSHHKALECRSIFKCKKCFKNHHTLLHFERVQKEPEPLKRVINSSRELSVTAKPFSPIMESSTQSAKSEENFTNSSPVIKSCISHFSFQREVLLCTAAIKVLDSSGEYQLCRALIDPGSQANLITEECARRLGLPRRNAKVFISCLGSVTRVNAKNVKDLSVEANSYEISSIRLLKLTLPVFSGSVEEWLSFNDLFTDI
ncbi:hypothetical protein X975_23938, partial [Stegodyphus mimosarum]